jgi:hypothetical protein
VSEILDMSRMPTASVLIDISRFKSRTAAPTRDCVSWNWLVHQLSTPTRTSCTTSTCSGSGCPHKDGGCWSPAVFAADMPRQKQCVEAVACLVLDIDHVSARAVAALQDHLARYEHIIHATHSDRDDDRCLRVVMQLSRAVLPSEWPMFVRAAIASLPAPADPLSMDIARLYFLPSRPRDADYFIVAHAGEPLDVDATLAAARAVNLAPPAQAPQEGV